MLFYIPKELLQLIDSFGADGWVIKKTATEEQRKEIERIREAMKREEEKMFSVELGH